MRNLEERQKERKLRNQTSNHNRRTKPAGEAESSYDLSSDDIRSLNMSELHAWADENGLKIPKDVSSKGHDAVAGYIVNAKKAKDAAPEGSKVEGWTANN